MPISYNIIEQGEPGVAGDGDTNFYTSAKSTGETDFNQLIERIEKISTISGADIRGCALCAACCSAQEMADGNIVRLADLGSFRVNISSVGHATADEVSSNIITKNVCF